METIRFEEYHPYRTVTVEGVYLTIPRWWVKELEEVLCRQAGVLVDNHTAFKFEYLDSHSFTPFSLSDTIEPYFPSTEIYVSFHDGIATFGTYIKGTKQNG